MRVTATALTTKTIMALTIELVTALTIEIVMATKNDTQLSFFCHSLSASGVTNDKNSQSKNTKRVLRHI